MTLPACPPAQVPAITTATEPMAMASPHEV